MIDQLFDDALATTPPSTVDVVDIIRRERRRHRARRLTAAVCAGIALVAAVLLVPNVIDRSAPAPLAHPSSPAVSAAPPPGAFRLVADTAASGGAHLTPALDAALHQHAPGASWIFEPDYEGQKPGPDGQPPRVDCGTYGHGQVACVGNGAVLRDGRKG